MRELRNTKGSMQKRLEKRICLDRKKQSDEALGPQAQTGICSEDEMLGEADTCKDDHHRHIKYSELATR